jgi:hypothetical protein
MLFSNNLDYTTSKIGVAVLLLLLTSDADVRVTPETKREKSQIMGEKK